MIGEGPAALGQDRPAAVHPDRRDHAGLPDRRRDRFGILSRLRYDHELEAIVARGAAILGVALTRDGAVEIARRARGTPRVASRLLRRVRDFATVAGSAEVDAAVADRGLTSSRSTISAWTAWTGAISGPSPRATAAVRSASRRSLRRSRSSATPWKRWSSRICSSRGCCNAPARPPCATRLATAPRPRAATRCASRRSGCSTTIRWDRRR